MWELDHKEGWALKNWCFRIVVLEKTLESPLDFKEITWVNPKGNQPWIFIGRADAEAEAPILWPLNVKRWLIGKDSDAGKYCRQQKGTQRMKWLDSITDSVVNLSKLQKIVEDRGAWHAAVHGVAKSWAWLSNNNNLILSVKESWDASRDTGYLSSPKFLIQNTRVSPSHRQACVRAQEC